jgi:hypothetical protein
MVFSGTEPDRLIYCSSERFDEGQMGRFGGACVAITDPRSFFAAVDAVLRAALEEKARTLGPVESGWCEYIGRVHSWDQVNRPEYWLLKPAEEYPDQREFRAAWAVDVAETVIIESTQIAACCRRFR